MTNNDLQNITQKTKDRATRTTLELQIIYLTNRQKDKQRSTKHYTEN